MIRTSWPATCLVAVSLCLQPSVRGDVVETFTLMEVHSVSLPGDALNDARSVRSSGGSPYTVGSLTWSGSASPTADPDDPTAFPSWGADLGVRISHVPSGAQADLLLGNGDEFGPGPRTFAGSTRALNGLQVAPGDAFLLEFFDDFDDPFVLPDAVWHSIQISLADDFVPPRAPPGEGVVRFQTWGSNTFPTGAGQAGAEFFRIQYGPGDEGPAIVQAVLNSHARSGDDLWFDSDEAGEPPALQGTFQANRLHGLAEPLVSFEEEHADPARSGDFAVLRLSFPPGEFLPGDAIHFGVDTDGGIGGPARGDAFASLVPPLTLTVLFDDGTLVAGDLQDVRLDVDHAAILDLTIDERALRSDVNSDGHVDGNDLLDMLLHFGHSRLATPAEGDTDGNGTIDSVDLATWREQVGLSRPGGSTQAAAVAEPGSTCLGLALAALGACTAISCRR